MAAVKSGMCGQEMKNTHTFFSRLLALRFVLMNSYEHNKNVCLHNINWFRLGRRWPDRSISHLMHNDDCVSCSGMRFKQRVSINEFQTVTMSPILCTCLFFQHFWAFFFFFSVFIILILLSFCVVYFFFLFLLNISFWPSNLFTTTQVRSPIFNVADAIRRNFMNSSMDSFRCKLVKLIFARFIFDFHFCFAYKMKNLIKILNFHWISWANNNRIFCLRFNSLKREILW